MNSFVFEYVFVVLLISYFLIFKLFCDLILLCDVFVIFELKKIVDIR